MITKMNMTTMTMTMMMLITSKIIKMIMKFKFTLVASALHLCT